MSVGYRAVQWSSYKRHYDLIVVVGIATYLATFFLAAKLSRQGPGAISDEVLILRALATCAFVMLTFALCIGPLARLDRRFLPLLYNRRHLGVATFLVGLAHGVLAIGYYHGFGRIFPLVSLLNSNTQFRSISAFPFEILGVAALVILFFMAATSHDFWLKNLTPRIWKALHMSVYLAWGLLVMHVALGALQSERSIIYSVLLVGSVVTVCGLHILAARVSRDLGIVGGRWIDVCPVDELTDGLGRVVCVRNAERIALFRHGDRVSALGNVCAHQGGPLGEGRIIDGCVTCPWHGYQYRPEDGCAPPPFIERVPTYPVRIENGRVQVCTEPLQPAATREPAHAV